jgi:hypothetical protein
VWLLGRIVSAAELIRSISLTNAYLVIIDRALRPANETWAASLNRNIHPIIIGR